MWFPNYPYALGYSYARPGDKAKSLDRFCDRLIEAGPESTWVDLGGGAAARPMQALRRRLEERGDTKKSARMICVDPRAGDLYTTVPSSSLVKADLREYVIPDDTFLVTCFGALCCASGFCRMRGDRVKFPGEEEPTNKDSPSLEPFTSSVREITASLVQRMPPGSEMCISVPEHITIGVTRALWGTHNRNNGVVDMTANSPQSELRASVYAQYDAPRIVTVRKCS